MISALIALAALALPASGPVEIDGIGTVIIVYVEPGDELLTDGAYMDAKRTDNNKRWIVISTDTPSDEFWSIYAHEKAHHIAWNKRGEDIDPHGSEFRRECRKLVKVRASYYCKGD